MKPPPFRYHRPKTVDEALSLIGRLNNCRLLAGGQSLVPMLNFRLLYPDDLVDLNAIPSLSGISIANDEVHIGAMTRQRAIEQDQALSDAIPILREAILYVGHQQTRNRGTVGGSLCHLDPASELPAVCILQDATFHVASAHARRSVSAESFIEGAMSPALRVGEMLLAVSFQPWAQGHGYAFLEHAKRAGDFALASASCLLTRVESGQVSRIAICVGGVGDRPFRLHRAEQALLGREPSEDLFIEAARSCFDLPGDGNHHASLEYKRSIAATLVKRALSLAVSRCRVDVPT